MPEVAAPEQFTQELWALTGSFQSLSQTESQSQSGAGDDLVLEGWVTFPDSLNSQGHSVRLHSRLVIFYPAIILTNLLIQRITTHSDGHRNSQQEHRDS